LDSIEKLCCVWPAILGAAGFSEKLQQEIEGNLKRMGTTPFTPGMKPSLPSYGTFDQIAPPPAKRSKLSEDSARWKETLPEENDPELQAAIAASLGNL
jgi:hypothetical protein